jgi:hypothetical protein
MVEGTNERTDGRRQRCTKFLPSHARLLDFDSKRQERKRKRERGRPRKREREREREGAEALSLERGQKDNLQKNFKKCWKMVKN